MDEQQLALDFSTTEGETLWVAWEKYQEKVQNERPAKQAINLLNETWSVLCRDLLPLCGYQDVPTGRKMTNADRARAEAFMKTVPAHSQIQQIQQKYPEGIPFYRGTPRSQRTYQNRLTAFLNSATVDQATAGPSVKSYVHQSSECAPSARRGHGKASSKRLTDRDHVYLKYSIQSKDLPEKLEAELQEFYRFLNDPHYPNRWRPSLSNRSLAIYRQDVELCLGWQHHYQEIPLETLSLTNLVPYIAPEELAHLTPKQRNEKWKSIILEFEVWIEEYFKFLTTAQKSYRANTRRNKINALKKVGEFLYWNHTDCRKDYLKIPILNQLSDLSRKFKQEANQESSNTATIIMKHKWPICLEKSTALATLKDDVLEVLRIACKPCYPDGRHKTQTSLADNYKQFLAIAFMIHIPARRQEEFRTLKFSLYCDINRPKKIGPHQLYHPLPDASQRQFNESQDFYDNYIYKDFTYNKKEYPDGIWILDIRRYKTKAKYGAQKIPIKNRVYSDGRTLYDYIEGYLYGVWKVDEYSHESYIHLYNGCQAEFKETSRWWLTLGRQSYLSSHSDQVNYSISDITIKDDNQLRHEAGFFFIRSRQCDRFHNSGTYKDFFINAVHGCIGKRISPHVFRSIWATWAFQVGLSDAQINSLAYAMGHSVKTLRDMYDRCSPEEKRRPIEEAIDEITFETLEETIRDEQGLYLIQIQEELDALSEAERDKLIAEYLEIDDK